MRPRVFPAEDFSELVGGGGNLAASMRPRVFPAEDMLARGRQAADVAMLQ